MPIFIPSDDLYTSRSTKSTHWDSTSSDSEVSESLSEGSVMSIPASMVNMPIYMKDQVMRYTGNSKTTTQFLRQIRASFANTDIELEPKMFFDVISLLVSGEALEVLEQNRRLTQCLDDSDIATGDDMIVHKDLLRTRFAPAQHDTKNDWMVDLQALK